LDQTTINDLGGLLKLNCIYSVVIPLKNEAGNIVDLINELEPVMDNLGHPWELICIDDGSTDGTRQILNRLISQKPYLRTIFFKKNYGQSSAFDAGFKSAKGEFVLTLDGDGQNDPKDIPRLIELLSDCDLVCGIRLKRKDSFIKRLTSRLANFVRSRVCEDEVQDTGCSLKVYRKNCLQQIKMYHGMHRFLPALFKMEGFRIKQIPVNHRERLKGKSNYNFFNRSFNTIADLLAVRWMKKRHLCYQIETKPHE
jgi:dolichol-phosphate mannosyltransferase